MWVPAALCRAWVAIMPSLVTSAVWRFRWLQFRQERLFGFLERSGHAAA